jgi:toxin ParE1/3/4
MQKIRVSPIALKDLMSIKEYITEELDSPGAALKIVKKIVDSYEKLRDYPGMGMSLNSKIDIPTDYRFLVSEEYIIFYKLEGKYVSIYRILNARMDYLKVLFTEKGI